MLTKNEGFIFRVPEDCSCSKLLIHLKILHQMPFLCRGSDFLLCLVKNFKTENHTWFICSVLYCNAR